MASRSTRSDQHCTSEQKRLCQRLAVLFDTNSKVCGHRGDTLSKQAYASIAALMRDVATNGPRWLETKIAERQKQLEHYESKEQY